MTEPVKFKIGLVQMRMASDPARNLSRAIDKITDAAERGARVIGLPELFRSPYFCQTENPTLFELAEPIPGPTTSAFCKLARKLKVVIVAPVFERRARGLYHNSVAVIDADGRIAGVYRKMHIPDDPGYYEKYYFTPGDLGFRAFDTKYGRIGVLICWDQWFPEAARLTALQGANVLFYPTAIGWHPKEKKQLGTAQRDAWLTVQRGHAIANGIYVATINRVGHERPAGGDGIEFWGTSFLADPQGVMLAEASTNKEETIVHELDLKYIEHIRRTWPFLRDRRIDEYAGLMNRFSDLPADTN